MHGSYALDFGTSIFGILMFDTGHPSSVTAGDKGVSRPGGTRMVTVKVPAGFGGDAGVRLNLGAIFLKLPRRCSHSSCNSSARRLASALAQRLGPFFLPVVVSQGPSK